MGASHDCRVDEAGRITIPEGIRASLHIEAGETVQLRREDGRIVVEPEITRAAAVTTISNGDADDATLEF
jgi:AbrB family looped-hinge helix DNA binding protein